MERFIVRADVVRRPGGAPVAECYAVRAKSLEAARVAVARRLTEQQVEHWAIRDGDEPFRWPTAALEALAFIDDGEGEG